MDKEKKKKIGLGCGIGFGIMLLTAFISSQLIFPVLFGRPKNIEAPDLVDMNYSAARKKLTELGLHAVVKDSIWSESAKIETIMEQDPEPGKMLKPESTIYVRLSKGSKMVGVPSILGLGYHEAFQSLRNSGLRGAVSDSVYSEIYSANTVVSAQPSVGNKITMGSTVRMKLSRGPEPVSDEPEPDIDIPENTTP